MSVKSPQELRYFINEYLYVAGSANRSLAPLDEPVPVMPEVRMRREDLVRWRNNYRMLAEFAAMVLGVRLEDLSALDLLTYLTNGPLGSVFHHAFKYHDPDSEFYLGAKCSGCPLADWQAKIDANNQELFDRLYEIGCERIDGVWVNKRG